MSGLSSTSRAGSVSGGPVPLRHRFRGDLQQLRLQVEVMAIRVEEALGRAAQVLATGDQEVAAEALAADDAIDDMLVSLTERCYDILCRQNPVASDLRFVVSVPRVLEELERIGDLSLRVVKLAPQQPLLAGHAATFGILLDMAGEAQRLFRLVVRAWSAMDLGPVERLMASGDAMRRHYAALMAEVMRLEGGTAVPRAVASLLAGRALERIGDHTVIMGERLRYLLTGDTAYLASEVR